jgi:uncharacterized membrane protein
LTLFGPRAIRGFVSSVPRNDSVSEREITTGRVLAAVAYLPGLCFIGLLEAPRNRFVRFHARQGLVLLAAEIVGAVAIAIVDGSLGSIPVLGLIAGASLRLMLGVLFLAVTVYGILKGASGEMIRIPVLADLAERMDF